MNFQQFGQTIQNRYPQYQGMDPASVGQKVVQKYPQYQSMIDQQAPQGNFLGGLLSAAARPFVDTAKTIGGAAFEGGRALDQAAGSPIAKAVGYQNDYLDKNNNTIQNPLLSQNELQQYNDNPTGQIMNQAKSSAGVLSYAVPFGKGANIATKALLPGAVSGTLQGISDPNATTQSVLTSAGLGTAGAGLSSGVMKMLGAATGAGNAMGNTGNAILRSQYKVTPQESARLGLPQALDTLNKQYGLSNINDISSIADRVTGANGLITKLTREAVAKADPVNTADVMNVAKNLLTNDAILQPDHIKNNFLNQMKNGLNSMATGKTLEGGDPLQTLDFIKKLEGKAATYSQAREESTKELGGLYGQMANHLKELLFNGSNGSNGADSVLNTMLKTPEVIKSMHDIHPHLGVNYETGVNNVNDLRHLASPFVKASIAAGKSANHSVGQVLNPYDALAGLIGVHGFGLPGAIATITAEKALNSNAGKSLIGNLLSKAGGALGKVGSPPQGAQNFINNSASHIGPLLQQASQ